MDINKKRLKVSGFSSELEKDIDTSKRLYVTAETEIVTTEHCDNKDGTEDITWKTKACGSIVIQQYGEVDKYICKSKRSPSQITRMKLMTECPANEDFEVFYEWFYSKLNFGDNIRDVIQFVKNL